MDIDGDGHLDILSGSYNDLHSKRDMAGLFQVLYGKKDGTFHKAEALKGTDGKSLIINPDADSVRAQWEASKRTAGKPLTTPAKDWVMDKICTRPFAVDWDGDGRLDLVVGNVAGTFYWFKGEGNGKFAPESQLLKGGGGPLKVPGGHSDPFVVDWDGDGDLDLLSGANDGGVYWAENRAGKGKVPDLLPFRPLIEFKPSPTPTEYSHEADFTGPARATRIWVDDVNGDGKLDILVGDSVTLVSPAKGVSEPEFKKKFADWKKALRAAWASHKAATDAQTRKKTWEEIAKLYKGGEEFMHEENTGFVWLYLQK